MSKRETGVGPSTKRGPRKTAKRLATKHAMLAERAAKKQFRPKKKA